MSTNSYPAGATSPPAPPPVDFNLSLTTNLGAPGSTFDAYGDCAQGKTVKVELVRQARPGGTPHVDQTHLEAVNSGRYKVSITNDLVGTPGFPVDAEVFVTCGKFTGHQAYVSTDRGYPSLTPIVTVQADGPCGMCIAHFKTLDRSGAVGVGHNYVDGLGRSASLDATTQELPSILVMGSTAGQQATVIAPHGTIHPYGDFAGGVEVAFAEGTAKDSYSVVTGAGPGASPHVKVFTHDPASGYHETASFFAFPESFRGGVRVASGDVYGGPEPEIVAVAGPGGGPHVRVFTMTGGLISEFFAYASNVTGGLSVAVGDVSPGGKQEIVTGAGPGGSAHVRTFDYRGSAIGSGFYAYAPSFTGGVWVAAGDVDGLEGDEIVTGAGAGGMPHVRWFTSVDGRSTSPGFYAYEDIPTGVRVAVRPVPAE